MTTIACVDPSAGWAWYAANCVPSAAVRTRSPWSPTGPRTGGAGGRASSPKHMADSLTRVAGALVGNVAGECTDPVPALGWARQQLAVEVRRGPRRHIEVRWDHAGRSRSVGTHA